MYVVVRCCWLLQVGRTARGRDGRGRALLMLMPEELGFLKYLKQAKVCTLDLVSCQAWSASCHNTAGMVFLFWQLSTPAPALSALKSVCMPFL
jgi:hypothetical protein